MSDYHGLDVSAKFDQIRIAIHTGTPNGNNLVGYPYQQALVEHLTRTLEDGTKVGPTSVVPWLEATNAVEFAQIESGDVLETVETVSFDANASQNEKVQAMNEYVAARIPEITTAIQRRLEYWGADRQLPVT